VLFKPMDRGSGSGIRHGKKFGSGNQYEHPGSYFRELRNNFGLKIPVLKFFDADPGDPESGIF
jgi:hypothetical protein